MCVCVFIRERRSVCLSNNVHLCLFLQLCECVRVCLRGQLCFPAVGFFVQRCVLCVCVCVELHLCFCVSLCIHKCSFFDIRRNRLLRLSTTDGGWVH